MGFGDIIKLAVPLYGKKKKNYESLARLLDSNDMKAVRKYAKQGKLHFVDSSLGVSRTIVKSDRFVSLQAATQDKEALKKIEKINSTILYNFKRIFFREFSSYSLEVIPGFVAPNILGFEYIKQAATLQLFASDHIHLLLLGDPGTGKTDIIRHASELSPISSFGLGSGTSGVGLTVSMKGDKILKGLLPQADEGIAAIDELNLMKKEDQAGLYNAMEKGFVTFDKGGKHIRLGAKVSVFATANPKGDKFRGQSLDGLRDQIPFDSALLTRFHMVFLIRKPDTEKFKEIASHIAKGDKAKINKNDISFIKSYVEYARSTDPEFPKDLEKEVVKFSEELKINESKFLVEVNPRMIIGLIRLAKARARAELREKVSKQDLDAAINLFRKSLDFRK